MSFPPDASPAFPPERKKKNDYLPESSRNLPQLGLLLHQDPQTF